MAFSINIDIRYHIAKRYLIAAHGITNISLFAHSHNVHYESVDANVGGPMTAARDNKPFKLSLKRLTLVNKLFDWIFAL